MKILPFPQTRFAPVLKRAIKARSNIKNHGFMAACVSCIALVLGFSITVIAAQKDFPVAFSASQSPFQGGPSAGFDVSGSLGGDIGISYRAVATSGEVAVHVNGNIQAAYPTNVTPNGKAAVSLRFTGDLNGGSLVSALGANVNVDARIRFSVCILPNPFGGCLQYLNVNENMGLLDEGFFLNPGSTFTPIFGTASTDNDADNVLGIGPNIDIPLLGSLGGQVNVNVSQTIWLTPTAINGVLLYTNLTTGAVGQMPFSITASDQQTVNLTTGPLGPGTWAFKIANLTLLNSFRNDVNLVLSPTINYVIGSWSLVNVPVDLIDETFALAFNTIQIADGFTVEVPCPPPVFGSCTLTGSGQFRLQGSGMAGLTYTLQTSTNMVDWVSHTDLVAGASGLIECLEDVENNAPACFYRLKWP